MRHNVSSQRSVVAGSHLGRSAPSRAVASATRVGVAVGLVLILAACTNPAPAPSSSPSETDSVAPTTTETPAPALALQPAASAADNQAYFDSVASTVTTIDGRSFVDALTAAGFDKTQMEVTFDRTDADLAADTIQFAIRFNGECLLGQNGPASGGYHSAVSALLGSGTCLLGTTRSIDW
ncbi:hypothetical protein D6T64_20905 [Cryobacterium melibiosiphilum]|uniref:DUF6993 domain-containing protein n=1 Tax=Cryobacterium melibiosiphilum TaxID=995039 RepID=A0A3A5M9W7_9MICO|nr:hypothetical protein [Cryobacterium melibiosiphilum]RJT84623.1 hypothetical protein D6T64_20905 [Cryobacterium melibiosiphilum]